MEIKILQVFYDKNGLPYKDKERQVHFPIAGTGFLGASNTTQIKFYYDELDNLDETTWVAVSKLPNGKVGSRVLESHLDSTLNEHYALLELDSYYTQYKGDVFISLQGYQGGVNLDYNEETSLYEIHGTPTIAATGSIKFTINYANQFVGSGETDNINFQRILADLGTKLGIRANSVYVDTLPNVGNDNTFYVIKNDPNDSNKANIYIWNSETKHYIWVGDNTLDLDNYFTDQEAQQFKQQIDEQLSSIVSGSPKGVYSSVSDLETAFPEGTEGIYLISSGDYAGHWFYWNGTAWTDGGEYLTDPGYDTLENALEEVTGNVVYQYQMNTRIPYNDLGSVWSPVANEASVKVACQEGDIFYVKGFGQYNGRLWAFADSSYNSLGDGGPSVVANDYIKIVAPANAAYVICNTATNEGVAWGLIKNQPLKDKVNGIIGETQNKFNDLSGSRKLFQYIDENQKITGQCWYGFDSETGIVGTLINENYARYPAFHVPAGTYTTTKLNSDVSYIVFDDETGGSFQEMFPEFGTATNIEYTITLTQGATIYPTITTVNGYTTLMIVSGTYMPSSLIPYGEKIIGLNEKLSIGNHTLEDVDEIIDTLDGEQNTPFMYIKSGKVTSNGHLAEYAQVDMKSKIVKVMARVIFARNTDTVVTLIAMPNNVENVVGPVGNIGRGSVHINWGQNQVAIQYFDSQGVNHNITGYSYNSLTADGETEYELGYEFLGNNTIRFYLPDGTTRDLTNSNFDLYNGNYFVFETSGGEQSASETVDVYFTGVFCSCEQGIYLRDNFKRANGPLGVANTGHTYKVFKSQRTSIYDF